MESRARRPKHAPANKKPKKKHKTLEQRRDPGLPETPVHVDEPPDRPPREDERRIPREPPVRRRPARRD